MNLKSPSPSGLSGPPATAGAVHLRAMTTADLPAAQALSAELHWPHRLADWEQAFRHAQGTVAEQDGRLVGTALRWRWGARHATLGLVIVSPALQGLGTGRRLMSALLDGLEGCTVLLHATTQGRPLYEKLGFVRTGELRQHQGVALPAPLMALPPGWRLRPAGQNDLAAMQALDAAARGMPRQDLVADLLAQAEAAVVLDHGGQACGFGLLRRFGRGHAIGPVVAPDAEGARALIAHLSGLNAGRFTRIDIDPAVAPDSGLPDWLQGLGLLPVDAPTTMVRAPAPGAAPAPVLQATGGARLFAIVTQAMG